LEDLSQVFLKNKLAIVAAVGVLAATAIGLSAMVMQTSEATSKLSDVVTGHFQTVDTNIKLDIANGVSQIDGSGLVPTSVSVRNYHGGWQDELALLNGNSMTPPGFRSCRKAS